MAEPTPEQYLDVAKKKYPNLKDHKAGSDSIIAKNPDTAQFVHIPFRSLDSQMASGTAPAKPGVPGGVAPRDDSPEAQAGRAKELAAVAARRQSQVAEKQALPGGTAPAVSRPAQEAQKPTGQVTSSNPPRTTVAPLRKP